MDRSAGHIGLTQLFNSLILPFIIKGNAKGAADAVMQEKWAENVGGKAYGTAVSSSGYNGSR